MITVLLSMIMFFGDAECATYQDDPCQIYGKVYYETRDPNRADYRVYVEESESFADVVVYEETNALYADRPGHWARVDNPGFANIYIYLERNRSLADFSIYYTETESFAGCNR